MIIDDRLCTGFRLWFRRSVGSDRVAVGVAVLCDCNFHLSSTTTHCAKDHPRECPSPLSHSRGRLHRRSSVHSPLHASLPSCSSLLPRSRASSTTGERSTGEESLVQCSLAQHPTPDMDQHPLAFKYLSSPFPWSHPYAFRRPAARVSSSTTHCAWTTLPSVQLPHPQPQVTTQKGFCVLTRCAFSFPLSCVSSTTGRCSTGEESLVQHLLSLAYPDLDRRPLISKNLSRLLYLIVQDPLRLYPPSHNLTRRM